MELPTATYAYIEPARARAELWRIPLVLLIVFVVWMAVTAGFTFLADRFLGISIVELGANGLANIGTEPQSVAVLLLTFLGLFLGIWIAVLVVHRRGLRSLFGWDAQNALRNFALGAGAVFLLLAVGYVLDPVGAPPLPNLDFWFWLSLLPVTILLVMIQITAEELVFRGYLQQQIMARSTNRLIWWVAPAVIFGALHYNPDSYGVFALVAIAQITLIALILSDITMRTGNLGAAIGIHFANNFIGMGLIGLGGMMNGLALYRVPYDLADTDTIGPVLYGQLGLTVVVFIIYMIVMHLRAQR